MDPRPGHFPNYSSTLWGIGFRYWVSSILTEMRRKSPIQQWVDSIPKNDMQTAGQSSSAQDVVDDFTTKTEEIDVSDEPPPMEKPKSLFRDSSFQSNDDYDPNDPHKTFLIESTESNDNVGSKLNISDRRLLKKTSKATLIRERSTNSEGNSPKHRYPFFRDSSFQSEGAASRCSSVESLLESRRVDAEAVLRGVGFGPSPARQQLARIPDRFLKPSRVEGINTEQFIKEEQKSMKMHECGVFGYRGLTGNPHVPPSNIVAKIIERISSREELPDSNFYLQISQHADIDTC